MTTVSIFPILMPDGPPSFCAVAGTRQSSGSTAGQALDAISAQLPADELKTLVIVQHMQPDELFTAVQQHRLGELMSRWRSARDLGAQALSPAEDRELQSLIDAEFQAAGERAARIAAQRGA